MLLDENENSFIASSGLVVFPRVEDEGERENDCS